MKTTTAQTTHTFTGKDLGIIIDESCGYADTLNERTINLAKEYGFECEDIAEENEDGSENEDRSQFLSEAGDDAVDFLNGLDCPSYCSFFFEDNSLFFSPSVENAKEDVGFVSGGEDSDPEDSDYPAADYEGEWLHVSDHGNATLYVREAGKDREIWSVV